MRAESTWEEIVITGIPVECFTNLDAYKRCRWPRVMACRPMVGDRVLAADGEVLEVVGVTHAQQGYTGPARLRVELWGARANV